MQDHVLKTVGISTIWGNTNYGNRLQNYAVEKTLINIGIMPCTLEMHEHPFSRGWITKKKILIYNSLHNPLIKKRQIAFDSFNKDYLHATRYIKWIESDGFICGSDQIWNYTFPEFGKEMFLQIDKSCSKIALSASFGVVDIPDNLINFYKDGLKGLTAISVREEAGASLVEKIIGRRPLVLIDPTMNLDSTEWRDISDASITPSESYCLTYFLGEKPSNLADICRKVCPGLEVISLNDKEFPNYYVASPSQFLDLIDHAKYVFTDSFHGCVFSILFNSPFLVFDRTSNEKPMESRISTLLGKFGLEHHHGACFSGESLVLDREYIDRVLNEERLLFRSYLTNLFTEDSYDEV